LFHNLKDLRWTPLSKWSPSNRLAYLTISNFFVS
jgi:hypothetical protein